MVDVVTISWCGSKRRGTVDTSKKLAGYQSKYVIILLAYGTQAENSHLFRGTINRVHLEGHEPARKRAFTPIV